MNDSARVGGRERCGSLERDIRTSLIFIRVRVRNDLSVLSVYEFRGDERAESS